MEKAMHAGPPASEADAGRGRTRRKKRRVDAVPVKRKTPVEADEGYGASHGYGPAHGGPTGPGDAPATPRPSEGEATPPPGPMERRHSRRGDRGE